MVSEGPGCGPLAVLFLSHGEAERCVGATWRGRAAHLMVPVLVCVLQGHMLTGLFPQAVKLPVSQSLFDEVTSQSTIT